MAAEGCLADMSGTYGSNSVRSIGPRGLGNNGLSPVEHEQARAMVQRKTWGIRKRLHWRNRLFKKIRRPKRLSRQGGAPMRRPRKFIRWDNVRAPPGSKWVPGGLWDRKGSPLQGLQPLYPPVKHTDEMGPRPWSKDASHSATSPWHLWGKKWESLTDKEKQAWADYLKIGEDPSLQKGKSPYKHYYPQEVAFGSRGAAVGSEIWEKYQRPMLEKQSRELQRKIAMRKIGKWIPPEALWGPEKDIEQTGKSRKGGPPSGPPAPLATVTKPKGKGEKGDLR